MNFLKTLFSSSDAASFSRVATFITILFSCGWVTHIVLKTHQLPALDGVSLLNGSIYGMGKINETIQKFDAK